MLDKFIADNKLRITEREGDRAVLRFGCRGRSLIVRTPGEAKNLTTACAVMLALTVSSRRQQRFFGCERLEELLSIIRERAQRNEIGFPVPSPLFADDRPLDMSPGKIQRILP